MSQDRTFVIGILASLNAKMLLATNAAEALVKAGQAVDVIVRPRKSKRSIEQNKRYWALLREVSATVWVDGRQFSDEVWHEQFRRWFIGMVDMPDGSMVGISTTTLSVAEFTDYMTRIEHWCVEQGFPVMQEAA